MYIFGCNDDWNIMKKSNVNQTIISCAEQDLFDLSDL